MRRHSNKPRSPPRSITSARSSGDFSRVRSPLPKVRSGRATVRVSDDSNPACLSALPHVPDPDPDSLFHHFLGCLEFHQRDHFLDYQVEYWTTQVEEIVHFEASRAKAREQGIDKQELLEAAEDRVRKTIQALAISIEAQYKRTAVLRRAFSKQNFTPGCDAEEDYHFDAPRDPPGQPPGIRVVDEPDPGSLVWYINKSRSEWRSSMEYTAGIEKVREWRRHLGFPTDTATVNFDDTGEPEVEPGRRRVQEIVRELRGEESITKENISEYVLERDVNAHLIQYTRQSKLMAATGAGRKSILPLDLKMRHLPARPYEENLEDVRFKGKFPDQRVSVDLLLRSAHTKAKEYNRDIPQEDSASSGAHRNILSKDECDQKDPTRMRYLHIPANNMEWVESTIAGYYGDKHRYTQPALRRGQRRFPATRTQMLLQPQYWRDQLHGAQSGAVHTRYMRPLCERISSSVHVVEENPNNIVLFMPYMHWDTDRMRNAVAKMIDAESQKQNQKQEDRELTAKEERKQRRRGVGGAGKQLKHDDPYVDMDSQFKSRPAKLKLKRTLTLEGVVTKAATHSPGRIVIEHDGHLRVSSGHPLGQYLLDAARLYEAMSTFRDQRMIQKYLYHNSPLHPRRTLDQSHHCPVKNTKARDRDQVVYRGTNINVEARHKLHEVPREAEDRKRWTPTFLADKASSMVRMWKMLTDRGYWRDEEGEDESRYYWQWDGHWSKTDQYGCEHCANEIRKTPRLIMVDQLWMWVLDEQTIITSFPTRYGRGFDLHGIHKSIQNRLSDTRENQIRSIFDIALIILDECTNPCFNITNTQDSDPRVLDIFSEAIGDVTGEHTITVQHVLHWTQRAIVDYRSRPKHGEISELPVQALLDIQIETVLQREIADIVDELDMMLSITRRQSELIRRFCRHVENVLDPDGCRAHGLEEEDYESSDDGNQEQSGVANSSTWELGGSSSVFQDGEEGECEPSKAPGLRKKAAIEEEQAKHKKQSEKRRDKSRRMKDLAWFRMQSQEVVCKVADRIEELEGLRKCATSVAQSVNDLINLKHQQGSIWESVNQAEEAVRQGRAIMIFTVLTIVFLPLSFVSSVFGMNNIDLDGENNTWTLRGQLDLMFPVAIAITVASLFFAFFGLLRAIIWSVYTYMMTLFVVRTGLYNLWLDYGGRQISAAVLRRLAAEKVLLLKADVRKARKLNQSKKAIQEAERQSKRRAAAEERLAGGVGTELSENGFLELSFKGLKDKFRIKLGLQELSEDWNEGVVATQARGQQAGSMATVGGGSHSMGGENSVGNPVRRRSPVVDDDFHAGTSDMV